MFLRANWHAGSTMYVWPRHLLLLLSAPHFVALLSLQLQWDGMAITLLGRAGSDGGRAVHKPKGKASVLEDLTDCGATSVMLRTMAADSDVNRCPLNARPQLRAWTCSELCGEA